MAENTDEAPDPLLYAYIKLVNLDVLKFEMHNAGLLNVVDSVNATSSMVKIRVVRPLTANEQQKLYGVITNHHAHVITLDVAKMRVQAAMDLGKQILIEFAATNIVRGINIAQVKELTTQFGNIQLLLMSGSLYSALDEIQKLTPNALISQADKDYFSKKIMIFLGINCG